MHGDIESETMSTKLSCNEAFYAAIEAALKAKSDDELNTIAVVDMNGGTPAIHKNAALHFAAKLKEVIDGEETPSQKIERIERMISYVQKYEKDKKRLSERLNDAEQRAAAADAKAAELQKQLDAILAKDKNEDATKHNKKDKNKK